MSRRLLSFLLLLTPLQKGMKKSESKWPLRCYRKCKKEYTGGGKEMFRANTGHLQKALFSGLNQLPKNLNERLEDSWAGTFYDMIFIRIDEKPYAVLYADI